MKRQLERKVIERDFGEHLMGKYRATMRFIEESFPLINMRKDDSTRSGCEARELVEQAERTLDEHGMKGFVEERLGDMVEEKIKIK